MQRTGVFYCFDHRPIHYKTVLCLPINPTNGEQPVMGGAEVEAHEESESDDEATEAVKRKEKKKETNRLYGQRKALKKKYPSKRFPKEYTTEEINLWNQTNPNEQLRYYQP